MLRPIHSGLSAAIILGWMTLPTGASDAASGRATDRLKLPVPSAAAVHATVPRLGEGVVFDGRGRLFFSDAFDSAILEVKPDGTTSVWSREVRMPNGHKVLADGTHVVMEGGKDWQKPEAEGAVVHLDADGKLIKRLQADDRGNRFRWPNDIAVDTVNGGFYFSDPGRFMGNEPGRLYHVDKAWKITSVSDGTVDFPNGMVLRPDGSELLVAESLQNRILAFPVTAPGTLGEPRVFATMPSSPSVWTRGESEPDGIALDTDGRLYVAHFGAGAIRVYDRQGAYLGSYSLGASTMTNFAFGGEGRSSIFAITAMGQSFDEFALGGRMIRLTLPGVSGIELVK